MDEIKNTNEVTLSDLRQLGKEGGVTARLDNGDELNLRPRFGTVKRQGYVNGILQPVDIRQDYVAIYAHIRTIKRGDILVARREKQGKKFILKLTGKGYHRLID